MEEERYNELAQFLDELSEQDKIFCFWYLIEPVKEFCEIEAEELSNAANNCSDHSSYSNVLASIKASDHAKALKEIKEALVYKLF